ncbi:MAG: radical SAM protein [Atopobiaceae bacterium]|nr:radical SAM protein [Atopobiaceae bacterium]
MPLVLLIRPLCEGDEPEFAEPLGIERLAGYLRDHGVDDVHVLDRRLYAAEHRAGFFDDVRDIVGERVPALIGLSLMTSADVADARRVMSRLHAWWPQATLAAGGVYVTGDYEKAARLLPRGCVLLRGEGEAQLLGLALGRAVDASAAALASPDDWAIPLRLCPERYAALGCAVNLQSSRGCPGSCAFCATPSLPESLRRWQGRDLRLVVDEMQQVAERLAAFGLPPVLNFVDDDFGSLARLEALADELDARSLRVAFACELRLAALIGRPRLAERLACLREVGLTRVFFGVESLNADTLARWRKPYDVSRLPEVLEAFASAGIAVQPGYILWHGSQTLEGALAEVTRLRELGIYSHKAALSRLIVFPGCALAESGSNEVGFQPMGRREEAFHQRLVHETAELARAWTKAAIAEPHTAAVAHLTGDDTRLTELRHTLDDVNERSYQRFVQMIQEALA